jgi:hypothetical protein
MNAANGKHQHSVAELQCLAAWQKLPTPVMWRLAIRAFENGAISESLFTVCEDFTARQSPGMRAAETADVALSRIRANARRCKAVKR